MKQRVGIAQALLNSPKLLICDEPTSALDPVGRKEILDILSTISAQTTVLFSTHILSDVERVCTDVAFLHEGVIHTDGKIVDIKARYSGEAYQVEVKNEADGLLFKESFEGMQLLGKYQLLFREGEQTVFDVMRFASERHIPLSKLELVEPTLEDLFMEVVEK